MSGPVPSTWRRALEILRWRGPGYFLLLALREVPAAGDVLVRLEYLPHRS